jgi:hypothetical protein
MTNLQRLTTEYIDLEDRIRLSGEAENAELVVIWLPQRLVQRLLPVLLQWLARQTLETLREEALQSFAQQAALAELAPQEPIQPHTDSAEWLAISVDIAQSEQVVSLTFLGNDQQGASLMLTVQSLRQWLGIVYEAYIKADWAVDVWPPWMRESRLVSGQRGAAVH